MKENAPEKYGKDFEKFCRKLTKGLKSRNRKFRLPLFVYEWRAKIKKAMPKPTVDTLTDQIKKLAPVYPTVVTATLIGINVGMRFLKDNATKLIEYSVSKGLIHKKQKRIILARLKIRQSSDISYIIEEAKTYYEKNLANIEKLSIIAFSIAGGKISAVLVAPIPEKEENLFTRLVTLCKRTKSKNKL